MNGMHAMVYVVMLVWLQDLQTMKAKLSDGVVCYVTPLNRSDAVTPEVFKNLTFNVSLCLTSA